MQDTLQELICKLKSADDKMSELISSNDIISEIELESLDRKYQLLFGLMTCADLKCPAQRAERLSYLLELLFTSTDKSEYLKKITDLMKRDIKYITKMATYRDDTDDNSHADIECNIAALSS
jgi:hypothetical protein